jgi:hypothetical protein
MTLLARNLTAPSGVESHGPSSSSPLAVRIMSRPDGEGEEAVSIMIKAVHSP